MDSIRIQDDKNQQIENKQTNKQITPFGFWMFLTLALFPVPPGFSIEPHIFILSEWWIDLSKLHLSFCNSFTILNNLLLSLDQN